MTILHKSTTSTLFADKRAIQQTVAEQNEIMGFVKDLSATAEQARAMILADGVRPQENFFSHGIIVARNEE